MESCVKLTSNNLTFELKRTHLSFDAKQMTKGLSVHPI